MGAGRPIYAPVFVRTGAVLLRLSRKGHLLESGGGIFRSCSSASIGGVLIGLTRVTKVGGRVAFRSTERAFTALLLRRRSSVCAVSGFLNRGDVRVARECLGGSVLALGGGTGRFSIFKGAGFSRRW